ncbi:FAR-17a/AIG1-like protein-domain-containing protein [Massariosphaeria phaeospora]|uniref:FAR-17a/AIG1-like protein-domain-containing protein n=1 Tax=Massariosphaeria phaeospora TaxID=100035 RepID=A0A7C8IK75_9PLEO|nr:FAR-17a/AIG1-like protein-domain-containing protein [Massariosphaeria phaeospora]
MSSSSSSSSSSTPASQLAAKLGRRHPLQRLESPGWGFSGTLHVVGLLIFYRDFRYLTLNPNIISSSYGWHFQYLTILGLTISTLTFLLGLLGDLLTSPPLFLLKNYLLLLATPISLLISLLYWPLRLLSPSLVVPPHLPMLPLTDDLGFHFFPAVFLTLDALLLSPPWPTRPANPHAPALTLGVSMGLAFAYWFWIERCYQHNGFYPYPIFGLLSTGQRVGLFALSGGMMWAVGAGLRRAYAAVNGLEGEEAEGAMGRRVE